MDSLLIIFAKAPVAGQVKTRLTGHISPADAARLQAAFISDTVDKARQVKGADARLAYTPAGERGLVEAICGGRLRDIVAQEGAGLGERMEGALSAAFSGGYKKAVLIGTDIPGLSVNVMGTAFFALGGADVVLGPAKDGGYYLIGMKRPVPGLFGGIRWSGPDVAAATLARARELGLLVKTLPELADVDTFEDLSGLEIPEMPKETRSVLEGFGDKLNITSHGPRHGLP